MTYAYQLPRKCVQHVKRRYPKRQVLRRIVRQVFDYFEHECAYCGAEAESIDHVVSRQQRGDNSPSNLVAACLKCNQNKGSKSLEKWYTEKNHPQWTQYRCDLITAWRSG